MAEAEVARDGAVLTITLNRPDVLNALTPELLRLVREGLDEACAPEVRAVVLTGAGRGFCVGQDLEAFRHGIANVAELLAAHYDPVVLGIRSLGKPVIAAVNGPVAGAGLSLASVCDIRIASDQAAFVPGFIGIGLVPDAGGTYYLPRILGEARAFEWMISNRRLTAVEAHAWGLVSEVVDHDALPARAAEVAQRLAAAPTRAIGLTKQLLAASSAATLEQQLAREAAIQSEATQTDDFREGVAAFLEKRPATFSGR
jgi:2-(1,2-epoxy-1,2-dihydrophenyl)acetyl-CoA isomerase